MLWTLEALYLLILRLQEKWADGQRMTYSIKFSGILNMPVSGKVNESSSLSEAVSELKSLCAIHA